MIVHLKLPLLAVNTRVPVEETRGHWSALLRRVTVGSNIRRAGIRRKITASRRLERQRRGEVPALAPGFVDVLSNYYTGYHSAVGTKRSFAFGSTTDAKRSRKSDVASVSDDDNEEPCDSEGFAAVADSEDEQPNNYMLSEEMREQVEIFLNQQKAQENAQDYFKF